MKVGKLSLVAAASAAVFAVAAVDAFATPIDVGSMALLYRQNNGPTAGGEFVWQRSGVDSSSNVYGLTIWPEGLGSHGVGANQFISFCVETTESVSIPGTYDADMNTKSVFTNIDLSPKTAWLYRQFIQGTLAGYDYTPGSGRVDSGAALQAAIWHFQSQVYSGGDLSGAQIALRDAFIAAANAAAPANIGNVRILNIWKFDSDRTQLNKRQDMLVMIPLPAPVWMAGIGLCGVVGFCIRRRSVRRDSLEPLEL